MDVWRTAIKPGGYFFCFSDWRQVPIITDAIQASGWIWRGINVWDKTEGARIANQAYFRAQAEFVVWGTSGSLKPYYKAGAPVLPGVFRAAIDSQKEHLTQKPVGVMAWLIGITKPTDIIGEPFSGSGATILACEQLNRKCRAMEIEPRYVDVAVRRWEKFTGKTAVLEKHKEESQ
jgi:site-specific DNA-methyltransferase (adenine-specific)